MKSFKVGETVQWTSQAQGYSKSKEGVVVAIVPAGERPDREAFLDLYKGAGCGFGRDHESYVVRVKNKHYWPRVSALQSKGS